ncbi:Lrp/AsnC family transcriptional regulator [Roseomonas sp. GC11]|uniref:Lrp/AsnC family transcriptional regulator n=1 Tax=Roseomonas sp. GC11 TaxID=2950546 RepID=UPI00210A18B0|nr:Lrp/AsnC family transcriptional regulator [Roseomonas sp. GC11]MCQ4162726.1 Lrp/AsnC family transcriptional regulator [Roseomonas sp. GC11]
MPQPPELDHFERAILAALQRDARLSVQELAEAVGLSTSSTWRRLKALQEGGYILDHVARLDAARLGLGQTVFAHVTLAKHNREALEAFERAIRERPEVLQCFSMTGSADYILRAVVRDAAHYERFLQEVVFVNPAVQNIASHFALREIKNSTALPL